MVGLHSATTTKYKKRKLWQKQRQPPFQLEQEYLFASGFQPGDLLTNEKEVLMHTQQHTGMKKM